MSVPAPGPAARLRSLAEKLIESPPAPLPGMVSLLLRTFSQQFFDLLGRLTDEEAVRFAQLVRRLADYVEHGDGEGGGNGPSGHPAR